MTDATVDVMGDLIAVGYGNMKWYVAKYNLGGTLQFLAKYPPDPTAGIGVNDKTFAVGADYNGNIFVGGRLTIAGISDPNGSPVVMKFSPGGGTPLWIQFIDAADGSPIPGYVSSLAVDTEGVVYASINMPATTNSQWIATRLNGVTGFPDWITYFTPSAPGACGNSPSPGCYAEGLVNKLKLDSAGNPYITGWMQYGSTTGSTTADIVTMRLDPFTGNVVWRSIYDTGSHNRNDQALSMALDLSDNVIVAGLSEDIAANTNDTRFRIVKYDDNGNQIWAAGSQANNQYHLARDVATDRAGNIYVTGQSGTTGTGSAIYTLKYTPDGTNEWIAREASGANSNNIGYRIATDFLGNAYVASQYNSNPDGVLIKYASPSPATGVPVYGWCWDLGGAPFYAVAVDSAANVFAVGADPINLITSFFTQAGTVSVPITSQDSPNFSLMDQSVWNLGSNQSYDKTGALISPDLTWNQSPTLNATFDFFGTTGGIATLSTTGDIFVGYRFDAQTGTYDVTYPGTVQIKVQDAGQLQSGQPVHMTAAFQPDATARLTSHGAPSIDAAVTGSLQATASVHVKLLLSGATLLDTDLFTLNYNSNRVDLVSLAQVFDAVGFPPPGQWKSWTDPFVGAVTVSCRYPKLDATGRLDANGNVTSVADQLFMTQKLDFTTLLLAALDSPVSNSYGVSGNNYNASGAVADAFYENDFGINQTLTFQPTPRVHIAFSDGLAAIDTDVSTNLANPTMITTANLPANWDGTLKISPTFKLPTTYTNNTDLETTSTLNFDALTFNLWAGTKAIDIVDWSKCYGCYQDTLGTFDINLLNSSTNLAFSNIDFTPIVVTGTTMTSLYAASRTELPMIIYDQTVPPLPSGFNSLMQQTTPMLLYGAGFNPSGPSAARATFEIYGRAVQISTTWLNNNTLLVQVPNYFRLLPGTGRITVHSLSDSNSLDMPITYPIPHLDSISPNLWAADPALASTPVVIVDGQTSAGNDSYIARRDYYTYLRDHLWNVGTVAGTGANDAIASWFPGFDFNQLPGFPMATFDGNPMPRFIESIPSGNLVLSLSESTYASPRLVNIQLTNPAPGGGASNVLQFNIGAPLPVISSIEPSSVQPRTDPLTIVVHGPDNVATFQGYEEPKTGNFNASSVVRVNGMNLATTFVNSSELHAVIPSSFLGSYANLIITVESSSNGSAYYEELHTGTTRCVGGTNSGQACTTNSNCPGGTCSDIMWQGNVPSGCAVIGINPDGSPLYQCESAPILFHVGFPNPTITSINPIQFSQCSLAVNGTQPYNIGVTGSGFATGAVVWVNGQPRVTTRASDTLLQVKLLPADVSSAATLQITVTNPAPDGATSQPASLPVVFADCNSNGTSDQCEILGGTAQDCNTNGIPDSCDIASGASQDVNHNGIPDECAGGRPGGGAPIDAAAGNLGAAKIDATAAGSGRHSRK